MNNNKGINNKAFKFNSKNKTSFISIVFLHQEKLAIFVIIKKKMC